MDLSKKTVKDLKDICRKYNIPGFSKLRKNEIIQLIRSQPDFRERTERKETKEEEEEEEEKTTHHHLMNKKDRKRRGLNFVIQNPLLKDEILSLMDARSMESLNKNDLITVLKSGSLSFVRKFLKEFKIQFTYRNIYFIYQEPIPLNILKYLVHTYPKILNRKNVKQTLNIPDDQWENFSYLLRKHNQANPLSEDDKHKFILTLIINNQPQKLAVFHSLFPDVKIYNSIVMNKITEHEDAITSALRNLQMNMVHHIGREAYQYARDNHMLL